MERPKVRFSQTSEASTSQTNKEDTNTLNSKGKVRVKSIVPVNLPIKILQNGKRVLAKEPKSLNANYRNSNNEHNSNHMTDLNSRVSPPSVFISEDETFNESRKLSILSGSEISTDEKFITADFCSQSKEDLRNHDHSELNNCTNKLKAMRISKNLTNTNSAAKIEGSDKDDKNVTNKTSNNKSTDTNIPCITCDSSDENNDIEILKIINNSKKQKHFQKNKHNSDANYNKRSNIYTKSAKETKTNTGNELCKKSAKENKENHSESVITNKVQEKLPSNTTVLSDATNAYCKTFKKVPTKKTQNKLQVMPCAKFKLASLTNKNKYKDNLAKSQVKKRTVFNVTGNPCKVSVEPETLHKNYDDDSDNDLETNERLDITSKNFLSRPEYNSTICVIKKLKEIEKEKLVTGVEHLPTAYKNFIYGKVSAALDFAPYETVYKDLINLSVADDKLPARLVRSKDPEPRNKDIVPKLSDFYNPKYTEQYFTVVNPIAINPVSVNTLSAFTISNKICTWKMCRDNV